MEKQQCLKCKSRNTEIVKEHETSKEYKCKNCGLEFED